MEPDIRHRAVWPTFLWALLAFCLFGLLVVGAVWHFGGGFETYPEQRARERSEALAELRKTEEQNLNTYGWVDQEKGIARIPIARAMELTVAELGRKPVAASSVPVPTPAPPAPAEAPEGTGEVATPETPGEAPGGAAPPTEPPPAGEASTKPAPAGEASAEPAPAARAGQGGTPAPAADDQ